jgi:cobalt-zinc-cadmium efflux system outer membrane protein
MAKNPGLFAAAKRVVAATARATQARSWRNPELELSAAEVPIRAGAFARSQQLIGLEQTISFPGKRMLAIESASREIEISQREFQAARVAVELEVKTAFYRALAAQQRIESFCQLAKLADLLAEAVRKRVEAGAASAQEQLRAEIETERIKTELASQCRELAAARQSLAALLGNPELADAELLGALTESADAGESEASGEQLLRNHPQLAAATAELQRAEIEARRARLDALPDLTFSVAIGTDRATRETLMEFRVSLPLPLFDRSEGRSRETRATRDIARAELTATQQRLLRDLSRAEARRRTAIEQVAAYRQRILPKSVEALRLAQTGYDQGKLSFLDLLDTQRMAAQTNLAYQELLLELNLARAELEALLQRDAGAPSSAQPTTPK